MKTKTLSSDDVSNAIHRFAVPPTMSNFVTSTIGSQAGSWSEYFQYRNLLQGLGYDKNLANKSPLVAAGLPTDVASLLPGSVNPQPVSESVPQLPASLPAAAGYMLPAASNLPPVVPVGSNLPPVIDNYFSVPPGLLNSQEASSQNIQQNMPQVAVANAYNPTASSELQQINAELKDDVSLLNAKGSGPVLTLNDYDSLAPQLIENIAARSKIDITQIKTDKNMKTKQESSSEESDASKRAITNSNAPKDILDIKYSQLEDKLMNDIRRRQAVLQKLEQESITRHYTKPDPIPVEKLGDIFQRISQDMIVRSLGDKNDTVTNNKNPINNPIRITTEEDNLGLLEGEEHGPTAKRSLVDKIGYQNSLLSSLHRQRKHMRQKIPANKKHSGPTQRPPTQSFLDKEFSDPLSIYNDRSPVPLDAPSDTQADSLDTLADTLDSTNDMSGFIRLPIRVDDATTHSSLTQLSIQTALTNIYNKRVLKDKNKKSNELTSSQMHTANSEPEEPENVTPTISSHVQQFKYTTANVLKQDKGTSSNNHNQNKTHDKFSEKETIAIEEQARKPLSSKEDEIKYTSIEDSKHNDQNASSDQEKDTVMNKEEENKNTSIHDHDNDSKHTTSNYHEDENKHTSVSDSKQDKHSSSHTDSELDTSSSDSSSIENTTNNQSKNEKYTSSTDGESPKHNVSSEGSEKNKYTSSNDSESAKHTSSSVTNSTEHTANSDNKKDKHTSSGDGEPVKQTSSSISDAVEHTTNSDSDKDKHTSSSVSESSKYTSSSENEEEEDKLNAFSRDNLFTNKMFNSVITEAMTNKKSSATDNVMSQKKSDISKKPNRRKFNIGRLQFGLMNGNNVR